MAIHIDNDKRTWTNLWLCHCLLFCMCLRWAAMRYMQYGRWYVVVPTAILYVVTWCDVSPVGLMRTLGLTRLRLPFGMVWPSRESWDSSNLDLFQTYLTERKNIKKHHQGRNCKTSITALKLYLVLFQPLEKMVDSEPQFLGGKLLWNLGFIL